DGLHRVTFAAVWESPQESGSRAVGITFGGEQGVMGLSEPVAEAVGVAASMIEGIIGELLAMRREQAPTFVAPAHEQLSEQGAKS
ncbi:MAG: hypothetical protein ACREDH_09470, partial [Methylocella sp.]